MIEVITGSMFSGKSKELKRRLEREVYAKKKIIVFKPSIDTRTEHVSTHDGETIKTISISKPEEILKYNADVIGIDEVQFFDRSIIDVVKKLNNKKIIISGLDMDFMGNPFETTILLMGIADKVDKLKAVCVKCGNDANISYKLTNSQERIDVGNMYEARCWKCYNKISD